MDIIIDYINEEERQPILEQQQASGWRLKEDQRHLDGKHLVFTNEPYVAPIAPRDLAAEFDTLKQKLIDKGIVSASEIL